MDEVNVQVTDRRLLIRGRRVLPEPIEQEKKGARVLALEIDYGPFEREVLLPGEVDVEKVSAEQENGLLWIYLPLKKS